MGNLCFDKAYIGFFGYDSISIDRVKLNRLLFFEIKKAINF